jgi:hypothetical protein
MVRILLVRQIMWRVHYDRLEPASVNAPEPKAVVIHCHFHRGPPLHYAISTSLEIMPRWSVNRARYSLHLCATGVSMVSMGRLLFHQLVP